MSVVNMKVSDVCIGGLKARINAVFRMQTFQVAPEFRLALGWDGVQLPKRLMLIMHLGVAVPCQHMSNAIWALSTGEQQ